MRALFALAPDMLNIVHATSRGRFIVGSMWKRTIGLSIYAPIRLVIRTPGKRSPPGSSISILSTTA
jgi:hypothetical protein